MLLSDVKSRIYRFRQLVNNVVTPLRTKRTKPDQSKPVAIIRVRDYFTFQHYIYPFALSLYESGVIPYLHLNASMLQNIEFNRDLQLLKDPRISLYYFRPPSSYKYVFQDYMSMEGVILTPDYYNFFGEGAIRLPMFGHNDFYFNHFDKIPLDHKRIRKYRVGFIGSSVIGEKDTFGYASESLQKYFGVSNRIDCKTSLMSAFMDSSDKVRLDFHWVEVDGKMPVIQYLERLESIDFFLHLPGVIMPECYNSLESMSRGCIPITAYHTHFDPPLKEGETCLTYDGSAQSLVDTVHKALAMPDTMVQHLRKNVVHYYEDHLSLKAVGTKIISSYNDINWIQLMSEWRSLQMLTRSSVKRYNTKPTINCKISEVGK